MRRSRVRAPSSPPLHPAPSKKLEARDQVCATTADHRSRDLGAMTFHERTPNHTSRDLAHVVHTKLEKASRTPSVEVVEELLQFAYLSSLRTEEGVSIRCTFAYIRQNAPDPDPPPYVRINRWSYSSFGESIELTLRSIAKLAPATDSDHAALAVSSNGRTLRIQGVFDLQGLYRAFLRNERSGGWSPPGIFQVEVIAAGHIRVTDGPQSIGRATSCGVGTRSLGCPK